MNKSEIIQNIIFRSSGLRSADIDKAVKLLLDLMGSALAGGGRVEVRGFGSFVLHTRKTTRSPQPQDGGKCHPAFQACPTFQTR